MTLIKAAGRLPAWKNSLVRRARRFRTALGNVSIVLLVLGGWIGSAFGRDAFVLLSGGVSPMDNNYSQYLQARAVAAYFERNYPRESVWTFFGAGNVEGEVPILGDVRREVTRDGLALDTWLPGAVRRNRPARRDVFLRALREEILPAVAGGGTLYLFVGDHGSQAGTDGESEIDLWALEPDPTNGRGWKPGEHESLSVSDLRDVLSKGLGRGRVVFCMTQCHSGGFHYLAVPREMRPDPKWFAPVPAWAAGRREQKAFPRVAGFTSTDERSLAAGCMSDPDPENWVGYERFLPESLLGLNLFTLEPSGTGLRSFAEAHAAATLVDRTVDKPRSTSEQFLERWATLIESRLAGEAKLTDRVKKMVTAYQRSVDGNPGKVSDRAWRERQVQFQKFTERLAEQNPAVKTLVLTGTRAELEQAQRGRGGRGNRPPAVVEGAPPPTTNSPASPPDQTTPRRQGRGGARSGGASETARLWSNTLRPAWQKAVESNEVAPVLGRAIDFEKQLLRLEGRGRDFFAVTSAPLLEDEAYWRSGYAKPQTLDQPTAEAVIHWASVRREKILAWGVTASDTSVRSAAERLSPRAPRTTTGTNVTSTTTATAAQPVAETARPVSRRVAAERVLFYRRTLAAWEFLLAVNDRPSLARLRELIDLEATPLPSSGSRAVVAPVK